MELSLSKLPWYAQIGAFVVVSGLAVFGFWKFYVPQFQAEVTELERRLDNLRAVLPEEKDVADILRRVQGLATQSSLNIQRFTPGELKQEPLYAALPYKLRAEGTYHNLGLFFDRIS